MWKKWALRNEVVEGAEGSTAPVVQEGGSPPDDSNIWDDLLDEGGDEAASVDEGLGEATTAEEVGGEAETKADVVVEAEAPKPAVAEVAPVVEAPVVEVAVAPAPAPATVVSPQPAETPQPTITEEMRQFARQQALAGLAERYKLSEEDASALQIEPEKVLPKLAANLHAAIYEQVLQRVVAEAPAFIESSLRMQDSTRKAEEAFYGRWGSLRNHEAEVNKVAVMWRQMYPNASLEEAIEGVGQAASALLGLGGQVAAPVAMAVAPTPPPPPAGPSSRVGAVPPSRSKLSAEEQSFADLAKTFEEEF